MSQFNALPSEMVQTTRKPTGAGMMETRSGEDQCKFLLFLRDRIIAADIAEEIALRAPRAEVRSVVSRAEFLSALGRAPAPSGVFVELEGLGPHWPLVRDSLVPLGTRIVLLGAAAEDLAERGLSPAGTRLLARPYGAADIAAVMQATPDCGDRA